ncbi:YwmB family TATA-box binding protein [Bacillus sp. JCM 19034]|uniref:YwmB family TATA-box binding protein n=1 Tax=Bacillus sp. JCM 19034 TaxID=1481928 RepID=UPI00078026CF|nr:YwmB family TATA-box binding protein [Bacillus sp. JCM 19034]
MAYWRMVVVAGLLLLLIGCIHAYGASKDVLAYQQPLSQFYQFVHDADLEVEEWQIRIRDQRLLLFTSEEDFIHHINELELVNKGWSEEDFEVADTQWSASYTYVNEELPIVESVRFFVQPTSSINKESNHIITYQVNANDLVTEAELNKTVEKRIEELGLDNGDSYVQVRANEVQNDMNNNSIKTKAEDWLMQLQADKVEELVEDHLISFSAYQPDWDYRLVTGDKIMNVQMALRDVEGLGTRTTVTIGTPIITTEY